MRRITAFILAALLLLPAFGASVSAEKELPFTLTPPSNVTVQWLEGNDSPTTMRFAYTVDNEMTQFFSEYETAANDGELEAFLADYPFDEL